MRILLCSYAFAPGTGGIETVSRILAEQFVRLGSTVTVVTSTPGEPDSAEYRVVRRPSWKQLRQLARASDLVFQNNISLQSLLPLLSLRKPVVITHQTWIARVNGRRSWQDYLKLAILPLCHNIAISGAVAAALPVKAPVIGNPFDPGEFQAPREGARGNSLVFLGRLVSDKGCDLALRALSLLKADGICPSLSIIGDGPELPALKALTADLGLTDQVVFLGSLGKGRGKEVARHAIMVIPSRWAEPFGVVALEGLGAGCVLVASSAGGLPEAVGPCGILFENGDAGALAAALRTLLADPALQDRLASKSARHLEQFQPETVANQYLDVFQADLRR